MSGGEKSGVSSIGTLLGGVKRLKIDDQDSSTPSRLNDAFPNHWTSTSSWGSSPSPSTGGKLPITIYSDLNLTEDRIACGVSNGSIALVDTSRPTLPITGSAKGAAKLPLCRTHRKLSSLVCSKTRPELVYSASAKDGTVCLWDFRLDTLQPTLTFSASGSSRIGGSESASKRVRPLLCLDVSPGDQVLSAGTELVDEDSFILFWDVRMNDDAGNGDKLLGAYWESHSDDVTAVKFHPDKFNFLATGSTDGLLNSFNLLEANEDDALLYSFNTESSVESIHWNTNTIGSLPASCLSCVTHCNQVQIWDADRGDKFVNFDRPQISKAMMRSNPEAAFVNRCYWQKERTNGVSSMLGLLTCSLKGGCTRFIKIDGEKLEPNGIFLNQNAIVQTAEYIPNSNKWLTFDEDGIVRAWNMEESNCGDEVETIITKRRKTDVDHELTKPSSKNSSDNPSSLMRRDMSRRKKKL
ncbi:WD repeat-containing protein 89 [Folsomia candida]|uniref:WD repeat-containing protein 89 n=1 Tax=Folsomia candida TaxID=158441 RepID=A0A226F6P7_FOLCA|nr:WD repeat-containing protein 89 [Folsomia candida]OXA65167.1 WD repeat-containing protein 89 [Folsomia candida]